MGISWEHDGNIIMIGIYSLNLNEEYNIILYNII